MIHNKYILSGSIAALLLCSACTKNFALYNQDPYGVTEEELKTIPRGGTQIANLQDWVVPNQENGWQMTFDIVGVLSGLSATPGFSDDFHKLSPRQGWNDYPFDDTYTHIYPDFNPVRAYSNEDYNRFEFSWASILRVAISHRISDLYGPISFSGVVPGAKHVAYDKESDLYLNYLDILKHAADAIDIMEPVSYAKYADYDKVYGGDFKKWVRYARSLALRLAVRISAVEPEKAKEYAEWAVKAGVITTNADNAQEKTIDNPAYKTSVSWGDMRAGVDIVEYMKAFQDPRMEKFFKPAPGRGAIAGARGLNKASKDHNDKFSVPNIEKNSPIMWISAAEVAFLKAEGALLGWDMGNTPQELYEQGVKLSFEQWGVDANLATVYLQNNNTRGAFMDGYVEEISAPSFRSAITVKWDEAANLETKLSKIITQKWINFYPYNTIEAYTEWRRTGYPNLMGALVNNSGGQVADIVQENGKDKGGIRRLVYTQTEKSNNSASVTDAVAKLGGPDSYNTDLWWVRK